MLIGAIKCVGRFRVQRETPARFPIATRLRVVARLFPMLLILFVPGCDEMLPPRDEPVHFLETTASAVSGVAVYDAGGIQGTGGAFNLKVKNLYSEVLQGEEYIRGDIEVTMRDLPENQASVQVTGADLLNPNILYAGIVTLGPDTTASIWKQWDHRAANGQHFWEFVHLTPKITSHGRPYMESDPVHFVATARVQIFKNVQPVTVQQFEFTVVYQVF